ncbi:MAG: protein kinase family protein, partial [Planctomycetota bacterium]
MSGSPSEKEPTPPPEDSDSTRLIPPRPEDEAEAIGGEAPEEETVREEAYEDLEEIGRGGMGVILRTLDVHLDREVAKKVLLHDRPGPVRRFMREARLTGRLEHPNIPPVHALGVDEEGQHFFTMKIVKGETLAEILDRIAKKDPSALERYPLPRLLQIFIKACDAVAFA